MAHQIEQFSDGSAAFVSAREDAWHRLGTVTPDALTAEDALSTARLGGWRVRKLTLTARELSLDGITMHEVERFYATARTNPVSGSTDILGVVGETYQPIQNEENCEILNAISDESGAHFETAGSLMGGRQVFVTMKLPNGMLLNGQDALDLYIAALNSHDGSTAFKLIITPVRIVCANTQAMAISAAKSSFSIRHTETAKGRIEEARRALGLTFRYLDEFQAQAERMMNADLAMADFKKVCDELWKPADQRKDSARTIGNSVRRDAALDQLFNQATTQAGIRGTRWAGLQSITEYIDHVAPAKDAYARAVRTVSGDSMRMKEAAARLLMV
jgi:phage/plasmid-like protein (TIGR03299 family)